MSSEKNLHGRQMTDPRYLPEDDNPELEIDLVEMMYRMLEKLKWIIGSAVVAMAIAGAFTKFCITPEYQATSKLYVLEAQDDIIDVSALNLSDKLAADYIQVFKNWHVHEEVLYMLNLPYTHRQIQRMLTITSPEDTRILEITVTSTDPQEAYDIAMAYATVAPKFIVEKMRTEQPTIFEEARVPDRPFSPNLMLNLAVGAFLGAAIAAAIVFVQFVSDDRVRNAEMLQKRLGLATLGMMPIQGEPERSSKRNGKGAKA